MKSIIAICLILGLVGSALATESTATPGTFLKGPYKILSAGTGGNATDIPVWGAGNKAKSGTTDVLYTGATLRFYPGTDNTTIWLSAADVATDASTIAYVITRKLAVAPLSNGSQSTANVDSVTTAGTTATITYAKTFVTASRLIGTAGASYIIAQSETDSTAKTVMLQLYVVTAGASTPKTLVTSSATTTWVSGTTDGTNYAYIPLAIWGEDGAVYVLYESQVYSKPNGGSVETYTAAVMIQGYNSTANIYTTPATVLAAGTLTAPTTLGTAVVTSGVAGGNNYTNSTTFLVAFQDATATTPKTYFYTVVASTGVSTQLTTLTNGAGASGTSTYLSYTLGGIVPSTNNGTYGFIVGSATGATPTYNLSILLNGSTTLVTTGYSLGSPTANPYGAGFRYTSGYGIIGVIPGTSPSATYGYNLYFNNGTANTTALTSQAALGTFQPSLVPVSTFMDVNGSLWIGYGTADTYVYTASIAKVLDNVNTYYPAAGSALVTIAALLSFVIASLFMF